MKRIWDFTTKIIGTIVIFLGISITSFYIMDAIDRYRNREQDYLDELNAKRCPYKVGDTE